MNLHPVPTELAKLLVAEPLPQQSFSWTRMPWREQMHDLPDVLAALDALPDRVDRSSTREIVLAELDAGRVLPAFVSAMIWGHGGTGFGPVRTRWILTSVRSHRAREAPVLALVSERLGEGAATARRHGPLRAYQLMNNAGGIKHLGAAFFTKWLYFASAIQGPDDPVAAPIIDAKVTGWLNEHAGVTLDVNRTPSYEVYLNLLKAWSEHYGRSPVQVEKAIFGLATGRS